ncbi:endolysin [Mycobacterium phage Phlei]|uniref:Peptidase C39-like domain-containing protein n=1 Tax=Mycobacterium phage Phlei TaxID=1690684 RepID=A0A0N9BDL4_9CAUD|nr:endolysin [Mycobacterium phage Phlei]ALA48119.1 hypothetical protein [Mycobacterium phage Phlei]
MEKVLPYDRNVVPQETGYWCGPASTQVALNSRGIVVPEATLAAEIGTTTRGTDYVGLIERVLDRRVPEAKYTSVYIENDPPTQAQKERLWEHIVRSIDNGWGVIMNWVAPPSNKPRGVKGSPNPSYSGGTTYHYVACMGYDDTPGARALWIADSGFRPFNYWISFDQAATLIPPKGYCYADLPPKSFNRAADTLAKAAGISYTKAQEILPTMQQGLRLAECNNKFRIAMFIAQTGHESAGFNATEEYASGAAYEGRTDLGNIHPGDGVRFKGRTWIQITGRSNYTQFSDWAYRNGLVPNSKYFVDNPQQLTDVKWAGIGAAWYWTVARPFINSLCDNADLVGVTRAINGGTNGLEDRRTRFNRALDLDKELLYILEGEQDDMAQVPQSEWNRVRDELTKKFPSRSPLRHLGEGLVDTWAGMDLNQDANLHILIVKTLAEIGVESQIDLLFEVANADPKKYPDRQQDRKLALAILADIEATRPHILKDYYAKKGIA